MRIQGKIVYVDINGGFWGIEGNDGQEYRPIHMPEQLKKVGARVNVIAKEVDVMSMFMWGISVELITYHTLNP